MTKSGNPKTTLRHLPPPVVIQETGRLPWQIVNLRQLAEILKPTHARSRCGSIAEKGHRRSPPAWFTNRIRAFRLSAVECWLGGSTTPEWQLWQRIVGQTRTEAECRQASAKFVQLLGEKVLRPAGTTWARGGFRNYVGDLAGSAAVIES